MQARRRLNAAFAVSVLVALGGLMMLTAGCASSTTNPPSSTRQTPKTSKAPTETSKPTSETSKAPAKKPAVPKRSEKKPKMPPKTSQAVQQAENDMLLELQMTWGDKVKSVKITEEGSRIRADIYTNYAAQPSAKDAALAMAKIGAQPLSLVEKRSQVMTDAYVWPQDKKFYIARASGTWSGGRLEEPLKTSVNDVLK